MKALTICQPYAHLIASGAKRVENRTWPTKHRGLIAIHAGKSRTWLDTGESETSEGRHSNYGIPVSRMVFGAVVAIANLVDCVLLDAGHIDYQRARDAKYPWLASHEHANGPWCWILEDVKPLARAVPWRGAQGLFDIPDEVLK